MTLAVCHNDRWTDKPVLDCIRERTAPFSPDDVAAEFAGILKEYRIPRFAVTAMLVNGRATAFQLTASPTCRPSCPNRRFIWNA